MNYRSTNTSLWTTLRKALQLDTNLYEDVLSTRANRHIALRIVVLAGLSHMAGSAVILLINRTSFLILLIALFLDVLSIILGYYLYTFLVFKVGKCLKPTNPSYQELLSPIGFAYAPQVLNFLTLIPLLGRAIEFVLSIWSFLAVTVAIRQGLDLQTRNAALISVIGWIPIQFFKSVVILLFSSTNSANYL
ncbi:MAG TPA: YIP1 family protein [Leptolyngbyaceae cyanobacterium]